MTALDPCHPTVITCLESDSGEVRLLFPHSIFERRPLNGFSEAGFTYKKSTLRWFPASCTSSKGDLQYFCPVLHT